MNVQQLSAWLARWSRLVERAPTWLPAISIAALALAVMLPNLHEPATPMFDEHHYVPAARALMSFQRNTNLEHPLLAKQFIGASIAVFGDHPTAWRAPGVMMGVVTIIGVFAATYILFQSNMTASLAALFTLLNQLVFVQSRIAMLDVYMGAFAVAGLALCLAAARGTMRDAVRNQRFISASAICFGLSVACKWATAPYLAALIIAFAATRLREAIGAGARPLEAIVGASFKAWPGVSLIGAVSRLGFISIAAYLLTFWPMLFLENGALTWAGVVEFQFTMLQKQLSPLGPHPEVSYWWQWPLPVQPHWYAFGDVEQIRRVVLFVANPVIIWSGIAATLTCLVWGFRDREWVLVTAALIFLISYAWWAVNPKKISFYYYFYLPGVLLSIPLAAAFHRLRENWPILRSAVLSVVFLFGALLSFAYFYPVLAARAIGTGDEWLRWVLIGSWLQ